MGQAEQFLIWGLDDQRYGLSIAEVDRVVQMVEIHALPVPAPGVLGVINVHGQVTPVFRLEGPATRPTGVRPNQQLVLAHTPRGPLALVSDEIYGLMDPTGGGEDIVPAEQMRPRPKQVGAVLKTPEGLVLVPSLEALLLQADAAGAALPTKTL